MNKPNFIFKVFLFLVALSATNAVAQTESKPPIAEPTYEIVLQILTASNAPSNKNSASPALAAVVKQLKTLYAFSDYRLTTTFLQRTSSSIEYKSVINDFGTNVSKDTPTFSEWSLRNLRVLVDSQGRKTIQFESFRFGARIPIMVQSFADGKTPPGISYEPIGINTSRFTVRENEPTVIGSLATAKADDLTFLILTVKPVE